MSYEEEDTIPPVELAFAYCDTCHMRRRIQYLRSNLRLPIVQMSYEEEDTCHMRRRIHVKRTTDGL